MRVTRLRAAVAVALGLAGMISAGALPAAAANSDPVRLAVVVPLIVPATDTGLISAESLELYTRPQGLLTRQLDAVVDRQVAIAIDPMILVSIRVLGSSAPESALGWLDRLANATNQTFPLAYADTDVTLATQSGYFGVLGPEDLGFALDPGLFAPVGAEPTPTPGVSLEPTPTPTPTVDPDGPPLPTTAELLAWPYTITGIAWPRESTVVADDLAAITAGGYTTTILSSENVAPDAGSGSLIDADGHRILISDDAVSAALRAAADAALADSDRATTALADAIRGAGAAQPDDAVVVATLGHSIPAPGSRLGGTLAALEADPAIELVPFTAAGSVAPGTGTVVDLPQPEDRLDQAARMLAATALEASFATAAAEPAQITSERRLTLLGLFSVAWLQNPGAWPEAVDEFMTASRTLRESVHLVKSSDFLLVADSNQFLPITVRNDLTQPVTVYVTVRSATGLLVVGNGHVELPVAAGSQAKVDVPVRSLSNGVVRVDVTLTSAAGVLLGSPISSRVNVQAGWETPIVVVVASLVVIVFGVGIVRTVLRRRKAADD